MTRIALEWLASLRSWDRENYLWYYDSNIFHNDIHMYERGGIHENEKLCLNEKLRKGRLGQAADN